MKQFSRIPAIILATGALLFVTPRVEAVSAPPGTSLTDTIELSTGPNGGTEGMALNRTTHKLYMSGGGGLRGPAIKVVDTSTATVIRTISTKGNYLSAIAVDESAAPAGNKLYAVVGTDTANFQSVTYALRIIDANSDTPLTDSSSDIQLPAITIPTDAAVNPATHKIYILNQDGTVMVVDGNTRTVLKTLSSRAGVNSRFIVNPEANKVLLLNEAGKQSAVIDGASDTVTNFTNPFSPVDAVYDSTDGRIYGYGIDSTNVPPAPGLYVLNGATGAIITFTNTNIPETRALAVDGPSHRLFLAGYDGKGFVIRAIDTTDYSIKSNYNQTALKMKFETSNGGQLIFLPNFRLAADAIETLNLTDGSVKQTVVAYTPAQLAVNSKTNRVYVSNEKAAELTVLDASNHTVIARMPVRTPVISAESPTFLNVLPRYIAVSEARNQVFLNGFATNADGSRSGVVDVFDGATNQLIDTIVNASSAQLAVDDTRGQLYVAGIGTFNGVSVSGLLVYSTQTHALVAAIPLPEGCNGISVNQVTGRVYVSGAGNLRKVQIIDGNTNKIVAAVDAGEPYQSAVNRKTNKVFIVRAPNSVSVLNGATDSYETSFNNTTQNGFGQDNVGNVGVDEVTNTVYVLDQANGNGAIGRITAFDGNNNYAFLGQVDLGRYPTDLVIDQTTREVFVSNDKDGTVSVLRNSTSAPPDLLGNISTRLRVDAGDNALIGGFIVAGPQSATKTLMIRAIGPSLASAGVPGSLSDTLLELHDSAGNIIKNDDWKAGGTINDQPYASDKARIVATGIAPTDDRESAIIVTLPTGPATGIVTGKGGAAGVGLVEVYDLDQGSQLQLANISTRGRVGTGENVMIGGLIVLGSKPQRVVLRALGPSLASSGVQGTLQDTVLELHDPNGAIVAINDDWKKEYPSDTESPERIAAVVATSIAPTDDRESAIVASLYPANYTAIVRGKKNANGDETIGVALVEAYNLQ